MSECVIEHMSVAELMESKDEIAKAYHEFGAVVFPGLLRAEPAYLRYLSELRALMRTVIARHGPEPPFEDLGELLVRLCAGQALDGKIITDLGTQPNKFFSFNQLKYAHWIDELLALVLGPDRLCVTPQAGDTLHFFPPMESFRRYNLPPHQDYPYLMQSPRQVTCYIGLSDHVPGVGGLRLWLGSHRLGLLPCTKNEFGAFEIADQATVLRDFPTLDYQWNVGDFGIFDSLLAHSSIPNTSRNAGRVVQIFRFSDLNDERAMSYDYYSTAYPRRGVDFVDVHAELYSPEPVERSS